MLGIAGDVVVVGATGPTGTAAPIQAVDPSGVLELPGSVRGPAAFLLVLTLGAALAWRFEATLARSIEATLDRPLVAVVYGAGALGVVVFASAYLTTQLAPLLGQGGGAVGLAVGGLLIVGASSLGFVVVGSMIVELWSGQRSSAGLVVGALIAGGAAAIDPVAGGVLWFVVVSTGIGGPVREWVHASAGAEVADSRRD